LLIALALPSDSLYILQMHSHLPSTNLLGGLLLAALLLRPAR
jgi:hypothetical protein